MSKRQRPARSDRSSNKPGPAQLGPTRIALVASIGVVFIGGLLFALSRTTPPPSSQALKTPAGATNAVPAPPPAATTTSSPSAQTSTAPDPQALALVGRWRRPDGGYLLEIRSVLPEGRMEASYFNPSPIHVSRAEWTSSHGKTRLLIELQGANYPGSLYNLAYSPEEDVLVGTYYQAMLKQTFDVGFTRER